MSLEGWVENHSLKLKATDRAAAIDEVGVRKYTTTVWNVKTWSSTSHGESKESCCQVAIWELQNLTFLECDQFQ